MIKHLSKECPGGRTNFPEMEKCVRRRGILQDEFVAGSMNSEQVYRRRWIGLNLLAER